MIDPLVDYIATAMARNIERAERIREAAPDLLALCVEVEKFCPVDVQDRIRAAIRKATGEDQPDPVAAKIAALRNLCPQVTED